MYEDSDCLLQSAPDIKSTRAPCRKTEHQLTPSGALAARSLVSSLRQHRHLSNVFTHLCGADWPHLERAFEGLLATEGRRLPLNRLQVDIVSLACLHRGVSARTFGRWLREHLYALIGERSYQVVLAHWHILAFELEEAGPQLRKRALRIIATHGEH